MTRRERVFAAINHKESDKIAKGEIGIGVAYKLVRDLLGKDYNTNGDKEALFENTKRVRELLNMDLLTVDLDGPPPEDVGIYRGYVIHKDIFGRETVHPEMGAIKTLKPIFTDVKDVYSYEFPSVDIFNTTTIEKWVKETDFFVFPVVNGAIELAFELLNFESYMTWCNTNKKEIKVFTKKLTEYGTACAKLCVEAGANGIVIPDDMAFNTGTFLSPETLRELIFPYLKKEVEEIKKIGVPVILHTDGNVISVMDDIIDLGVDGLQALQPSAGMDIAEIKRRYGDKLCLFGNIDIDLLGRGTPDDIERQVKRVIEVAAPGGGFILSSSNELGLETSASNACAMYTAGEKFGKYPIR